MIWATRFHTHRTAYHEGNLENTRMDFRTRGDLMVRPLAHLDIDHTRSGEPIMTTLTLVDPQPMETLPKTGVVFAEVTNTKTEIRFVGTYDAKDVSFWMASPRDMAFHAWSRTATFGEGA